MSQVSQEGAFAHKIVVYLMYLINLLNSSEN